MLKLYHYADTAYFCLENAGYSQSRAVRKRKDKGTGLMSSVPDRYEQLALERKRGSQISCFCGLLPGTARASPAARGNTGPDFSGHSCHRRKAGRGS